EEDAARKVQEDASSVDYRLDRLGIPLVEIATGPEFSDPYTPAEVALYIGQLLRATGKVKRGIGTIRQDINISISGGARQEIKGVQELALISKVIENEIQRQVSLLEIRDELRKRGASTVEKKFVDVTDVFSYTKSRVIQNVIEAGGVVLAVKLSKFAGLIGRELQPGRRFGTELADHAKTYGGVKGIFHTDELPAYGISIEELERLRKVVEALPTDAVIFVADVRDKAEAALSAVVDRANQALIGIPEETRRALPDGTTEFMRPLPGAGRMYPETDIAPIPISEDKIKAIKSSLPELPELRKKRFIDKYRLSESLAERIALSENVDLFETLIRKYKVEPTLVASTLEETIVNLRREGVQTVNITPLALEEIFKYISKGALAKEAIPDVLRLVASGASVSSAVKQLGLGRMSKAELVTLISEIVQSNLGLVEERGEAAVKPLMGMIMSKVRGRVDGKLVYELLERELKKVSKR
ncbi:MAG: Glu-tRNA(Gln) amidotransferase subunit GatE, partial [Hadesarchaea archaeon]|nr:Glu-tRNA(Gln) amidotransferase subunit GatE [Hadesarchaea archaeon]